MGGGARETGVRASARAKPSFTQGHTPCAPPHARKQHVRMHVAPTYMLELRLDLREACHHFELYFRHITLHVCQMTPHFVLEHRRNLQHLLFRVDNQVLLD